MLLCVWCYRKRAELEGRKCSFPSSSKAMSSQHPSDPVELRRINFPTAGNILMKRHVTNTHTQVQSTEESIFQSQFDAHTLSVSKQCCLFSRFACIYHRLSTVIKLVVFFGAPANDIIDCLTPICSHICSNWSGFFILLTHLSHNRGVCEHLLQRVKLFSLLLLMSQLACKHLCTHTFHYAELSFFVFIFS